MVNTSTKLSRQRVSLTLQCKIEEVNDANKTFCRENVTLVFIQIDTNLILDADLLTKHGLRNKTK